MTDHHRLNVIRNLTDPKAIGCQTASLKITGKLWKGNPRFRIGSGPWGDTLEQAIDRYAKRWMMGDAQ